MSENGGQYEIEETQENEEIYENKYDKDDKYGNEEKDFYGKKSDNNDTCYIMWPVFG